MLLSRCVACGAALEMHKGQSSNYVPLAPDHLWRYALLLIQTCNPTGAEQLRCSRETQQRARATALLTQETPLALRAKHRPPHDNPIATVSLLCLGDGSPVTSLRHVASCRAFAPQPQLRELPPAQIRRGKGTARISLLMNKKNQIVLTSAHCPCRWRPSLSFHCCFAVVLLSLDAIRVLDGSFLENVKSWICLFFEKLPSK